MWVWAAENLKHVEHTRDRSHLRSSIASAVQFPLRKLPFLCRAALARGGKVVVTGLLGGNFSIATAMFGIKAMTIEGTLSGTLAEARELLDLARARNIAPIPTRNRPLGDAQAALDDLRAGRIVGRTVLTA